MTASEREAFRKGAEAMRQTAAKFLENGEDLADMLESLARAIRGASDRIERLELPEPDHDD